MVSVSVSRGSFLSRRRLRPHSVRGWQSATMRKSFIELNFIMVFVRWSVCAPRNKRQERERVKAVNGNPMGAGHDKIGVSLGQSWRWSE